MYRFEKMNYNGIKYKINYRKMTDGNSTKEQKKFNIYIIGIPRRDRKNCTKDIFKDIIEENFPWLKEDKNK